jgi:3-hydroxyisobutyrate dehydrogenase-like beta-hydroxyacid dehydrogenase
MMSEGPWLGFVGIGRMGGPLCGRLLEAGHRLCIFDTNEDSTRPFAARGARVATSPAEVASTAPIVLLSLPTPAIVESVSLGSHGLADGSALKTIVDLSTTGAATAGRIAAQLDARGIAWVDAPVSGGVQGATAGSLAVIVSCPKGTLAQVEPILRTFGRIFYTGEKAGLAQTAKLANNLLGAAALATTAEACALGVKAGIDARVLLEIFNSGSGLNTATRDKFPRAVLTRTFDFGFATGLSHKDVRLCLEEAESLGIPMVVGAAVRQMLAITSARFGPDSDFTSVARVVEEWAGVEIKG